MANSKTDSRVEEVSDDVANLFLEGRPKMIWRFVTFMCLQRNRHQMLEDHVNAADKQNTELYQKTAERLERYPDEYQSYYLPTNDEDAEDKITSGRCFMAYLETIHWLLNNGEDEELLLLLYRGSHFLSLFYEMRYHHFLDALKMMMQISDEVFLEDINKSSDWGAWLRLFPDEMEEKLQNVESVGQLISTGKEKEYVNFRESLISKYGLNVDKGRENPWSIAPFN